MLDELNALVNEILAASRLHADLLVGQETPTSLRALLNEISKMMLAAQGKKNLQLEIDLPPEDQPLPYPCPRTQAGGSSAQHNSQCRFV